MKRLLIFIFIIVPFQGISQQDPLYSQYSQNLLPINPAYSGVKNQLDVSLNSRFQWTQVDGSPVTNIFTANTSLMGERGGLGLIIFSDKIGIDQTTEVHFTYGYKIDLGDNQILFGLQTGLINKRNSVENLTLRYQDDPFFEAGENSVSRINFGAGVFFKNDVLMVGFSIPKALNNDFSTTDLDGFRYTRHYYATAAYLYEINAGLMLKPLLVLRAVKGAPLSMNLNTSAIINNRYHVGLFTNNLRTLGAQFQFEYDSRYKLGYSFEILSDSNFASRFNSHELFLSISLEAFKGHGIYQHFF